MRPSLSPRRFWVPPPVGVLIAIAVMAALDRWLPIVEWITWPWTLLGTVSMAFGLAGNISAAVRFRRRGTTVIPFRESSALVTDGLNRLSRNPIYLSMALFLCGAAVVLGSLTPWFLVPAWMAWIEARFIRPEERILTERFGDEYRAYQSRVRRWL